MFADPVDPQAKRAGRGGDWSMLWKASGGLRFAVYGSHESSGK